ncbi:hypothetical protein GCM10011571_01610 [Marinithermofilum abyssi]|jgi:hypothetical protein|uniref:Uncharacterized protein n=1 Tax=Marinithermofilum abyssi TaxID=1571185 RepID=A0A8J2VBH3_9BACL|nr:hypothetical protein [Marinithermofilum abyssi]GGE04307.1 hypothetical protein GCM10011571_01610 [Marinithermofilum abyssi]
MEQWGNFFTYIGIAMGIGGIFLRIRDRSAGLELAALGALCLLIGWLA